MSDTGCCVAMHGTSRDGPWWSKSASVMVFEDSVLRSRLHLIHPWPAPTIPWQTISEQCGVPDLARDVNKLYTQYMFIVVLVLHWTFVLS